jgi:flagellum-specific ATP synthase
VTAGLTNTGSFPLERLAARIQAASRSLPFIRPVGEVSSVSPAAVALTGLSHCLRLGSLVDITSAGSAVLAEVIKLQRDVALCKPYDLDAAIALGDRATPHGELLFYPGPSWRGRIIDALARPVDGKGQLERGTDAVKLFAAPPAVMQRQIVSQAVRTGVRVIDAFTPLCLGQRIGVFAGSGVGKSTLLSMLARGGGFDTVVVSLVGERGREVREFIELTLGEAAKSAVTVVSTGDESAMLRRIAPQLAMSLAEFFRDRGDNVLLIMDSVTRYAHACREVALAAGEPPVARGYPPSVFSQLPRLLERAGPGENGNGTITGVFSVLVDGDDHNDPVADSVRGTLDGHIVLERAIGEQGRFPAVNVLSSISRLAPRAWTADQAKAVGELKRLAARYEETRDLRAMGAYVPGNDNELDKAVELVPKLYRALTQGAAEPPSIDAFREIAAGLSVQGGG